MFSECDFDFSKYLIIHCETKDYEKSKSRSEDIVFYNKNETICDDFHQRSLNSDYETQCFQNATFTFQNTY